MLFNLIKLKFKKGNISFSDSSMETRVATKKGTPMFSTPESLASNGVEEISQKSDIWSSGVLIHMMAYLAHPFHHPNFLEMMKKISEGKFINIYFTNTKN